MSNPRYPEEFKIQAVNQVTKRSCLSLMWRRVLACRRIWIKRYSKPQAERQQDDDQHAELRRLQAELKRVTEERDILKNAAAYFAKECDSRMPLSSSARAT